MAANLTFKLPCPPLAEVSRRDGGGNALSTSHQFLTVNR